MLVRSRRRSWGIHAWCASWGRVQGVDDDHGAVVTLGAGLQRHAGDLFVPVAVVFFDFKVGSGRRDWQKLPAQCELLCPVPIGEEAVVANTLKSFGQNVEQEPTDKLLGDDCHGLVTSLCSLTLP